MECVTGTSGHEQQHRVALGITTRVSKIEFRVWVRGWLQRVDVRLIEVIEVRRVSHADVAAVHVEAVGQQVVGTETVCRDAHACEESKISSFCNVPALLFTPGVLPIRPIEGYHSSRLCGYSGTDSTPVSCFKRQW